MCYKVASLEAAFLLTKKNLYDSMKKTSREINFILTYLYLAGECMKNRIKDFRNSAGITQQQLADLVYVSSRTIISLEKGQYNPSVLLAYKIAKVFHVSIEELFIFEEEDCNGK